MSLAEWVFGVVVVVAFIALLVIIIKWADDDNDWGNKG